MSDDNRKHSASSPKIERKNHSKNRKSGNYARKFSYPEKEAFTKNKNYRPGEPELPSDLDVSSLDPELRKELRTLEKRNADRVAAHLLMIEILGDDDPTKALEHARAAKERAGRIGAIRQITGLLAYSCGLWREAISELKAARRISGSDDIIPIIADCERGLQRPEKALEFIHSIDRTELALDTFIELVIVESGAYRDLSQYNEANTCLEIDALTSHIDSPVHARLYYAYAEAQLSAGNIAAAEKWFRASLQADNEGSDAQERITQLTVK